MAAHLGRFRYQLPWNTLIDDMIPLGGQMVHGGLAAHQDSALQFVAPPGGGKSTTLAGAPPDWQVLSDDAALVWPEVDGSWSASPLPSWTRLTAREPQPLLEISRCVPLKGLVMLEKAEAVKLERVMPLESAPALYRAVSEYPLLVMADVDCRRHAFHLACRLARELPCWHLALPLGGDVWPQLALEVWR